MNYKDQPIKLKKGDKFQSVTDGTSFVFDGLTEYEIANGKRKKLSSSIYNFTHLDGYNAGKPFGCREEDVRRGLLLFKYWIKL